MPYRFQKSFVCKHQRVVDEVNGQAHSAAAGNERRAVSGNLDDFESGKICLGEASFIVGSGE